MEQMSPEDIDLEGFPAMTQGCLGQWRGRAIDTDELPIADKWGRAQRRISPRQNRF
mgnify:CR=1 FL=1